MCCWLCLSRARVRPAWSARVHGMQSALCNAGELPFQAGRHRHRTPQVLSCPFHTASLIIDRYASLLHTSYLCIPLTPCRRVYLSAANEPSAPTRASSNARRGSSIPSLFHVQPRFGRGPGREAPFGGPSPPVSLLSVSRSVRNYHPAPRCN